MTIEVEEVPTWLREFLDKAALSYGDDKPSIGWRWLREEADVFDVIMYPNYIDIEGKACLVSDLRIDVFSILDLFESYEDISMNFHGSDDEEDHLSVSGSVHGHAVWLRLMGIPPEDADPVARMHPDGTFEEMDVPKEGSS